MKLFGALSRRSRSDRMEAEVAPPPFRPSLPGRAAPPVIALPPPRPAPRPRFDLRNMSPRQFAEAIHELYVEGSLKWEEYQLVGFPSELHPNFDSTIGALTGERAAPDRKRDMLAEVESQIEFLRRFLAGQEDFWRIERALDVLRRQAEPRYSA